MPVIPVKKLTFTDFEQILLHGIKGDKPEWIARSEKDFMVGSLHFC